MQQIWGKITTREKKLENDNTVRDRESPAFAMREAVARLKLCENPVEFWLAAASEAPRRANAGQREAHLLFCKTAADISSIVGHTCGVERAGKAYKQVLSSQRKSMDEARAMKSIFVYSNHNLHELKHSAGDAFSAFTNVDGDEHTAQYAAEERDPVEQH
eukprot:7384985-Prymnesium_polylepis.1